MHRARATVDLDAIVHNVGLMRDLVEPAALCAVVKADAYGHGALAVAHAAVRAGATWLAVATVEEAAELRAARLDVPCLVPICPDTMAPPVLREDIFPRSEDLEVTPSPPAATRCLEWAGSQPCIGVLETASHTSTTGSH